MSDMERDAIASGQEKFGVALSRVETEYPDDFSGAVGGTDRSVIFKAAAPAGALAVLTATGLPFQFKEHSGFSGRELSDAVLQVHREAVKIYPVNGVITAPDALRGVVWVAAPMSDSTLCAVGASGPAVTPTEGAARILATVRLPPGVTLEMHDVATSGGFAQTAASAG